MSNLTLKQKSVFNRSKNAATLVKNLELGFLTKQARYRKWDENENSL